jgi:hypothetical protein
MNHNIILQHPAALCIPRTSHRPWANSLMYQKFTLENHSSVPIILTQFLFRPNWLQSSGVKNVREIAAPLSRRYISHFKDGTIL